ncbi:TrkH family potassium uptake protein [Fibrobacter sp. UWEL]|uniref:TrkH family potassium uptake protein n=1 Tax=Fibrobacter sp. UWEL TaxID=1896209 RepID=UPI0009160CCC|nr:potassium transporter TrkG [Fibrobacter sp. UWEL]SHK86633.1 trk system potassium uptake protein TrkH [Fibrobacter sp. UWEL]
MLRSRYEAFDYVEKTVDKKKKTGNPIVMIVAGYLALISLGAFLLSMPFAQREHIGILDAFFTATSAVCVTGLSTIDISSSFNIFGNWILVILMQAGGLGIMTISTVIILLAGMHPGFNHQSALLANYTQEGNVDATRILKAVLPFMFGLEAVGAVMYFTQFNEFALEEYSLYDRIFGSVFQAISSFCNVGFTLFPDSMVRFQLNPIVNITTCVLALAGGFGFLAITEARYVFDFKKRSFQKVSLHTRIATGFTLIIVGVSIAFFIFSEWSNVFASLTFGEKVQSSVFMAFTSRTAGLNNVDVPSLSIGSLFFFIVIMLIGANPGSCGGGIKTTTTAVIALLGFNRLLGRKKTQILGRTIPETTVDKAVRIFVVAIVVVVAATLILLQTEANGNSIEQSNFLTILFEVVSAYSTCGLSMGITPDLSIPGKILICTVMFIGRMGPLFLISAVATNKDDGMWYAEEDIMVG